MKLWQNANTTVLISTKIWLEILPNVPLHCSKKTIFCTQTVIACQVSAPSGWNLATAIGILLSAVNIHSAGFCHIMTGPLAPPLASIINRCRIRMSGGLQEAVNVFLSKLPCRLGICCKTDQEIPVVSFLWLTSTVSFSSDVITEAMPSHFLFDDPSRREDKVPCHFKGLFFPSYWSRKWILEVLWHSRWPFKVVFVEAAWGQISCISLVQWWVTQVLSVSMNFPLPLQRLGAGAER